MNIDLSGHYTLRRISQAAFPCIIMMLVSSIYSIVDGIFISNFVGTQAFASVNLIYPPIMMVGALGIMVGTGGSALISKTMGEGEYEKANRIFSMLVYFLITFGSVLAIMFFIFIRPITLLLGAEGQMIQECIDYGRICILATPAFMLSMAFQSFYMTAGKPQLGTIMSIVCGVTNIIFDALLVAVFNFGIIGAALATAAAQFVGGLFPFLYFYSKRNNSTLRLQFTRFRLKYIGRSCLNGLSEYVGNIALNIACICYNLQLMRYLGQDGVAAYGILMYVGFIFCAVFIGYNLGISPVIGFNYGAQNHQELKSLFRKSITILSVAGIILTFIAEAGSHYLAAIFVSYDPDLLQLTTHAIHLYMLSFVLCGVNMFTSALFTALNNGIVSAIAAFARTMVFEIASLFILPLFLGIDGIWLAVDVAEVFALILSICLLIAYRKRYRY